jgi:HD-GYP domain-containing protein (c-di-GMP phosphodiesterase class II)
LRELSSVPEEVIKAVRHHHEREDGTGYPDRLVGSDIPIGAKIIVVCDSVDAMLSDRPYRRALPLTVVLDQLSEHAGTQFDAQLIKILLESDIFAGYAETMRVHRQEASAYKTDEPARVVPLPVLSMVSPSTPRLRKFQ